LTDALPVLDTGCASVRPRFDRRAEINSAAPKKGISEVFMNRSVSRLVQGLVTRMWGIGSRDRRQRGGSPAVEA